MAKVRHRSACYSACWLRRSSQRHDGRRGTVRLPGLRGGPVIATEGSSTLAVVRPPQRVRLPGRADSGTLVDTPRPTARHTRPGAIWPLCRATLVERGHVAADDFKA